MWFEVAITAMLLLAGHILFGHFEERTPRWRKLLKAGLALLLFPAVGYFLGPIWFFVALGLSMLPAIYIHAVWLPKYGINGWTGEPKEKYYQLRGWDK